jgi:uncharacterized membrane protein
MPSHDFIHVWGWLGVILMWGLWTLLVFGVGWRIAYQLHPKKHAAPHEEPGAAEDPLVILKRRYARGELTREQFEQ